MAYIETVPIRMRITIPASFKQKRVWMGEELRLGCNARYKLGAAQTVIQGWESVKLSMKRMSSELRNALTVESDHLKYGHTCRFPHNVFHHRLGNQCLFLAEVTLSADRLRRTGIVDAISVWTEQSDTYRFYLAWQSIEPDQWFTNSIFDSQQKK